MLIALSVKSKLRFINETINTLNNFKPDKVRPLVSM
jgi:hypothetical protein